MYMRKKVQDYCETIQDILDLDEVVIWSDKLKSLRESGVISSVEHSKLIDLLVDQALYIRVKGTELESTLF